MEISTQPRRPARLARVLVNTFSVLTMLLAIAFVLPAAFGFQRYVITGTSMSGTYDLGSVVFEEVVPVNELRVGDVITYMPPADSGIDHLVTHRIVSIKDGSFRTRGDAIDHADPWTFRLENVSQPRVSFAVPYVGWVLIALQDRTIRMALIGVPAALIALLSLVQLINAIRRRPDEADADAAPAATPTGPTHKRTPVSASKPRVSVGG